MRISTASSAAPSSSSSAGTRCTENAITLVEWPERAETALKPDRLAHPRSNSPGAGGRGPRRSPAPARCSARIERLRAIRALLERAGWDEAARVPIQGDASTRAYERLVKPSGETAILMISPPRADGPPVRRGKPYSAIAKLAESVHAFVAIDRGLRALGFSAPRIFGEDLDGGLLILEDLGDEPCHRRRGPDPGALRGGDAPPREAAFDRACRTCCRSRTARARATALRSRSPPDRGGASGRLVRAAHHRRATCPAPPAPNSSISGRRRSTRSSPVPPPGPCATTIRRT